MQSGTKSPQEIFKELQTTPPENRPATLDSLLMGLPPGETEAILPQLKRLEIGVDALKTQVARGIDEVKKELPRVKGAVIFGSVVTIGYDEDTKDVDIIVFSEGLSSTDNPHIEKILRKHVGITPHVIAVYASDPERRPDTFREQIRDITVNKSLFSDAPPSRHQETGNFRIYPWNYVGDPEFGRQLAEVLGELEPQIQAAQKRGFTYFERGI
ncbi:Uncharacterised protein [uncultured archaeon]|nr:Uncharacterised protein [uncultured archaeon]